MMGAPVAMSACSDIIELYGIPLVRRIISASIANKIYNTTPEPKQMSTCFYYALYQGT
jgi:hypothetical protein